MNDYLYELSLYLNKFISIWIIYIYVDIYIYMDIYVYMGNKIVFSSGNFNL